MSLKRRKSLSNYYRQKEIDYIDNSNIIGLKKLPQNRRGNSFFCEALIEVFK